MNSLYFTRSKHAGKKKKQDGGGEQGHERHRLKQSLIKTEWDLRLVSVLFLPRKKQNKTKQQP